MKEITIVGVDLAKSMSTVEGAGAGGVVAARAVFYDARIGTVEGPGRFHP